MSNVNKVILIGRLGQDPELKQLPSGSNVLNMSVATSESWIDKNTKQKNEKTEWHNIVLFGAAAENCNKYLSKGSQVYVEGKLQTRSWENKEGQKRYSTEILANNVQFLSTNREKNDALKEATDKAPEYKVETDASFATDDIPF